MEQQLLSVPDAAAALGVGRTTVFAMIAAGKIPSVTLGRRRLVPATAIRELAERLVREAANVAP
ncbi:MAG: helix-turn-helix domain-containing protein [Actinomycetota bacterium]